MGDLHAEGAASGRLRFLTRDDEDLLAETGTRVWYSAGDVLVRAGQTVPGLFVVRKGRVRLELNDRQGDDALASLDAVHVFGEGTLLGDERAAVSVVAEDEVQADLIDADIVRQLITTRPGFGIRLFRALASTLAERVRRVAERAAPPFVPG